MENKKVSKAWPNQNLVKVSVCITTFNENEETIKKLLDALNNQTLKPDEIIIIDAKDYNNCSRSEGRNISISKARNEIIAITDAGCVPHKDWLEKITLRLRSGQGETDVVAGGYEMIAKNNFEQAESVFLGVKQKDMNANFLPSTRSMSLTKTIWEKAGKFPEEFGNTAEDTIFNVMLFDIGAKFTIVKSAIVDWYLPDTITGFASKIYNYAKWDARSGIWWHPVKKWKTHNLKVLTIFARYALFSFYPWLILIYIIYAYFKAGFYSKAGLYGILLQFVSDIASMSGFIAGIIGFTHGILQTSFKRT